MDIALKEITIPFLREQGFKGSYPHFKRQRDNNINLLTFQFSLYSPQFTVEIANCPSTGITFLNGKFIEPQKCRVHHTGKRMRIGPSKGVKNSWYDFGQQSLFGNIYKKNAERIISNWREAEELWAENPAIY